MKVGDRVRYLNAVGGGTVTRIDGDIVYVDDDGFETPVLKRECVVVGDGLNAATVAPTPAAPSKQSPAPTAAPAPTKLPIVEVAGGDSLNVVLAFEASDLKALSRSTFDAYLVNDSNYWLYVVLMSRSADGRQWTHR